MRIRFVVLAGLILGMVAHNLHSAVLYTFSDSPTGVQLSYSGNINTAGLSNQGGLGSTFQFIDILGGVQPLTVLYEFENFQPSPSFPGQPGIGTRFNATGTSYSWNLTTAAQHYNASSAYGDTFGFYIFQRSGVYTTYLNLPYLYSGASINGGMFFAGQTLSSMGLTANESFQVYLPGNEVVSGIVVVPEPQPALILFFAVASILIGKRTSFRRRAVTAKSLEYEHDLF